MATQKGGRKLARSAKHKGKYQAQVFRTARNKAAAATRIARRKKENPNPRKVHWKRREKRERSRPVVKHYYMGKEIPPPPLPLQ